LQQLKLLVLSAEDIKQTFLYASFTTFPRIWLHERKCLFN